MKKVTARFLTASVLFLSLALTASPVFAISYDFNDGTNQGWTVQFNDGSAVAAAGWFDYTNYSGSPNLGLPPVIGPADPLDNHGAINGFGPGGTNDVPSISSFASPIFTAEAMENISAQFTLSTNEGGILGSISVLGQMGYRMEGSDAYFFGGFFPLNSVDIPGPSGGVQPLWTQASMDVPDDAMVNQIFVNIRVYGTPLVEGTQNWIDDVASTEDSGSVPGVPEPATMLLLGFGIIGLAGFKKKLNK